MSIQTDASVCGTIFADAEGRTCACEIEIPSPTPAEVRQNMTTVFPFICLHSGPHKGPPIVPTV